MENIQKAKNGEYGHILPGFSCEKCGAIYYAEQYIQVTGIEFTNKVLKDYNSSGEVFFTPCPSCGFYYDAWAVPEGYKYHGYCYMCGFKDFYDSPEKFFICDVCEERSIKKNKKEDAKSVKGKNEFYHVNMCVNCFAASRYTIDGEILGDAFVRCDCRALAYKGRPCPHCGNTFDDSEELEEVREPEIPDYDKKYTGFNESYRFDDKTFRCQECGNGRKIYTNDEHTSFRCECSDIEYSCYKYSEYPNLTGYSLCYLCGYWYDADQFECYHCEGYIDEYFYKEDGTPVLNTQMFECSNCKVIVAKKYKDDGTYGCPLCESYGLKDPWR